MPQTGHQAVHLEAGCHLQAQPQHTRLWQCVDRRAVDLGTAQAICVSSSSLRRSAQEPVQEVRQINLLNVKHSLLDAMLFEKGHLCQQPQEASDLGIQHKDLLAPHLHVTATVKLWRR